MYVSFFGLSHSLRSSLKRDSTPLMFRCCGLLAMLSESRIHSLILSLSTCSMSDIALQTAVPSCALKS